MTGKTGKEIFFFLFFYFLLCGLLPVHPESCFEENSHWFVKNTFIYVDVCFRIRRLFWIFFHHLHCRRRSLLIRIRLNRKCPIRFWWTWPRSVYFSARRRQHPEFWHLITTTTTIRVECRKEVHCHRRWNALSALRKAAILWASTSKWWTVERAASWWLRWPKAVPSTATVASAQVIFSFRSITKRWGSLPTHRHAPSCGERNSLAPMSGKI